MTRAPTRQRSEKRQRTRLVAVRFLPDEHDLIVAAAAVSVVSVSAYLRDAALFTATVQTLAPKRPEETT